jgi:hypothetical protein
MSWQRKQRMHNQSLPPVRVAGAAPRCHNCVGMPGVVRVHRDERRVTRRGPNCGYCGYAPEVVVTDDEKDRSELPPGQRFGDGGR